MQLLLSRRTVGSILSVSCGAFSSSFSPSSSSSPSWAVTSPKEFPSLPSSSSSSSMQQLAEYICQNTPISFRLALYESGGRFLYRGDDSEVEGTTPAAAADTIAETMLVTIPDASQWKINDLPPDLLFAETHENDLNALKYFECLERRLNDYDSKNNNNPTESIGSSVSSSSVSSSSVSSPATTTLLAMPSNGHIATSDPQEAGKWGSVVSVWPLGMDFSYVWPTQRSVFYNYDTKNSIINDNDNRKEDKTNIVHTTTTPAQETQPSSSASPFSLRRSWVNAVSSSSSSSSSSTRTTIRKRTNPLYCDNQDSLMINVGLSDALRMSREVLFATTGAEMAVTTTPHQWRDLNQHQQSQLQQGKQITSSSSAFLTIPMYRDEELRRALERLHYGGIY